MWAALTSLGPGPLTRIPTDESAAPPTSPAPKPGPCRLGLCMGPDLLPSWATEWPWDLGHLGGPSCTLVSCHVKWGQRHSNAH